MIRLALLLIIAAILRLRPEDRCADTSAVSSHAAGNWPLLRHEPPRT